MNENHARIKKSTKPARQELKINKKKITAGKKKRQSKKSKGEHTLPLFLNPVVIGISFVMGLVVLFAFAVYFKIL